MTDKPTNPLLERHNKMPGETIRLPSLGKFYTRGELTDDTHSGEITLKPMTMTDEIMMKSPDMLFQGTAIETVLSRCSHNIKKPLDLLTSDVDFILTHLRRISFGPFIEIEFTCQNTQAGVEHDEECGHKQEVRIPLEHFTNASKEIDPISFDEKFTVVTASDKRVVKLKPVTFADFLMMQQIRGESLNDPTNLREFVLDTFVAVILSVDDIQNDSELHREQIKEWLDVIPRNDTQQIIDAVANIQDWGPTFKYSVKCSKCKHKNDLTTELNPTAFFTLPSSQTIQK